MYIGLDLGTSGLKGVLIDDRQRVLAEATAPLLVTRPLGLRNLDNLTRRPSDPDAPPWAGESFADQDGQQWTLLDVQALLADERFMDIGV